MADGKRYRIQTDGALMATAFPSIEVAQAWANTWLPHGTPYFIEEAAIVRHFQAFKPSAPVATVAPAVSCKCCGGKCGAP